MEGVLEVSEALRRASLASHQDADRRHTLEKKIQDLNRGPVPKDTCSFVYVLFLFVGLLQFLPASFFVTANDYWMYKFRDTSLDTVDSNNRNTLQTIFASWSSIVSSVPMVICTLLSIFYGHKVEARPRLLITLSVVASAFTMFTVFVKTNTDTCEYVLGVLRDILIIGQTGFFILTMTVLVIINSMMAFFGASTMVLVAKFPPNYMKPFLFGQGCSGIFNSSLQVISLAIGTSSTTSALIYFCAGTFMIWFTLTLLFVSKYSAFYQYYMEGNVDDKKRPVIKIAEIMSTAKLIWPCIVCVCICMVAISLTHPAVTSLVVSENYGNGSDWSDKFFVPVITFLFSEICSLIGRVSATLSITRSTGLLWVALSVLRLFVCVPLLLLCNEKPRHNLPVVFNKDWEYAVFLALFFVTNGYFSNLTFLSVPQLCANNEELAFLTMMTIISVFGVAASPLGLIVVNLI